MPSTFKIIQVPALQDNYIYFVVCPVTGETAVIDTPDAPLTRNVVKREALHLTKILNTHHHWDHTGGNEDLLSRQKFDVYGFDGDSARIPGITHTVREGDHVSVGTIDFRVIEIPAHTSGHIAYVTDGAVFCGDTLFVAGCGRLFEGTALQMHRALQKLAALPDATRVYCAHEYSQKNLEFALTLEPENKALQEKYREVIAKRKKGESTVPTTIGEEKSYNPFLRTESPTILEFLRKRQLITSNDPIEVLAAIRKLKDQY